MAISEPPREPITIVKLSQSPKQSGILPVPFSSQKMKASNSQKPPRAATPKLKVVVRRLPPGLTEAEFWSFMGDEWRLAGSKVDWTSYTPGKMSRDPAKPSRPSRAYIHLLKPDFLSELSEKVRDTHFSDAKNSGSDLALLGPPSVEFAPSDRLPPLKPRKDGRQGTIDQDPEFIDFLQELTNPIPKPAPIEFSTDKEGKSLEKQVTPLVQFIRDKKANKGKDLNGTSKSLKHSRQDSKDGKISQSSEKKVATKGNKEITSDKRATSSIKGNKSTQDMARDVVKVLSKQAGNMKPKEVPKAALPARASVTSQADSTPPKPERKRERGSATAAAKILQRDLGLGGALNGRKKRENLNTPAISGQASQSSIPVKASEAIPPATSSTPAPAVKSSSTHTATTAPINSAIASESKSTKGAKASTSPVRTRSGKPKSQSSSSQQSAPKIPITSPEDISATPTATQAFLKHANPSQGITEPLLEEAFTAFGTVTKVLIDKKKGFAYINFSEPAGLQNAIAASPIKVAQGQVAVHERRSGVSLQNRNAKSGGAGSSARSSGSAAGGAGSAAGGVEGGTGGKIATGRNTSQKGRGRGRSSKAHMDSPALKQSGPATSATVPAPAPTLVSTKAATTSSLEQPAI